MKKVQLKLFSKSRILLLLFTVLSFPILHAQTSTVKGVVTDENNQPLPGANVIIKGSSTGTQSDFDGNYTIDAKNNSILVVSYVGYENQEINVGSKTSINIQLLPAANQMDEVVIIGYGTQKKSDLTGSVAMLDSKDIEKYTYNDASQALQGRVAGVSVQSSGGAPGAGSNIVIRGVSSFSNTSPLFIIDGMFTNSMSSIAPQDIENISVLKDASALAIYGSRAANGVVIVTTKKGKKGKITVDVDTSYGIQKVINTLDWADATEYSTIVNRARDNDGQARFPANDTNFDPNYSSDLYGESFRTAEVKNTNIRISGGGENTNYSLSFTQFEQEGVIKYSDFTRQSLRSKINFEKGKFKLENTIGLTRTTNNPNPYFNKERNLLPTIRLRNDAGEWSASDMEDRGFTGPLGVFYGSGTIINELALAALEDRTNTKNTLLTNAAASYEILDGLTYKVNLGLEWSLNNNYRFTPKAAVISNAGNKVEAELSESNTTFTSTLIEHTLNYNKTFDKHTIDLLGGFTEQLTDSRSLGVDARTFPSNDIRVVSAAEEIQNAPSRQVNTAMHSYLARLKYNFDDRYLITASYRSDESSLFKEGFRKANFMSGAIGWNVSNENFMEDVDTFTNVKLRLGYGATGSNNTNAYQTDAVLNFHSEYILDGTRQTGYAITSTVNPFISWETTKTTNFGLDFTTLNQKMNVSVDYFIKKTEDLLLNVEPVFYSGTGNQFPNNVGDMQNKGIEIFASYRDQIGDVKFSASANISALKNRVTSLGQNSAIPQGQFTSNSIFGTLTDVDRPVGSFYGWVVDGIYQTDAEGVAANDQQGNPGAGDIKFKDLDNDGDIDNDDRTHLGQPLPDFEYGFNLSAEYKGFDINLFFNGVSGNKILNGTKYRGYFDFNGNYLADAMNAWTPTNTSTNIPRNTQADPAFNRRMSDFYLEDGSYFRLRNAQVGYLIPKKFVDRIKLEKVRLYASATNLFTITDYSGYYPEVGRNSRGSNGRAVLNAGVDEGSYPTPRTFQLGLQVSF